MTLAILSFATRRTPGRVMFRCDDLLINEARDLETNPPFANWARAYETGHWTREALLGIGLAIGNWLDGPQRWLTRLAQAPAPVILVIETTKTPDSIEQAALDAPWELIARLGTERTSHALAPEQIDEPAPAPINELLAQLGPVDWQCVHHVALEPSFLLSAVRRLGPSTPSLEPSKYRLSVVFMPCQPDSAAELLGEVQEVAIRKASGRIRIDLEVEDSGSLEGLGDLIARLGGCDVLQVSCPATLSPRSALALEGARGERVDATAGDIWSGIGQKPRLLVVSAYAGAAPGPAASNRRAQNASTVAVGSRVLAPLSIELCQRGWPAVLELPGAAADQVEMDLAAALYRLLAQRVSLLEAFARARLAVAGAATGAMWHTARLLLGPGGGGQLVDSAGARPTRPGFIQDQQFLDPNRQIRIAADYQASLHRRAFQRVVAMLRGVGSPGIVVHGSDEVSRATFVSRVLQRMEHELRRVVVTVDFDASAILRAVREQTAHTEVATLARRYDDRLQGDPQQLRDALRAIVEGPCRDRGAGAFVLVLHNFDLTSTCDGMVVFRALLGAFVGAGTASRLLFTCSAPFPAVSDDGVDISRRLAWQSLAAGARGQEPVAPVAPARPTSPDISRAESVTRQQPTRQIQRTNDLPGSPSLQWQRILMAGLGIVVAGTGALAAIRREMPVRSKEPTPPDAALTDLSNMIRFEGADIRMGVFQSDARSGVCREHSGEGDCGKWQHPEASLTTTHVAAFDLDQKEATNEDFAAWLNATVNDWLPPGEDGLVKARQNHLTLVGTKSVRAKSCPDGLVITAEGRAQATAGLSHRPVVCVTWYGAKEYCHWLKKRLPYETEWELAAKGTQGRPFPWGTDLPRFDGVAYELSRPRDVGTSTQDVTPEGIYDLAGNVREWVSSDRDTPELRVVRGGSFEGHGPCSLLGSSCARLSPRRFSTEIGLRCARSVDETRSEFPVARHAER